MTQPGDPMHGITLHPADAAELAETLTLISDWLARDPAILQPSLTRFIGHPAYSIPQLRDDLCRFVFLLGGSDGEYFLAPEPGST
jgi:hypothetical protein